ncbi:serine proteinase stubble-like [Daphnia carinata]|uniref:serine proteinase stubble-like n=1 Tax=Daphnia carinata TaxID=120202 RepID=UPI00257E2E98|nr:serine proteinase stubble-like [Daphnia carinata]
MMASVRWCVLVTVTLNWLTITPLNAGPVSINPAISPFGRNIRPITCKSRTGQLGTCMFAMDCTRMNGQHLGTCIDRFYFGSCCAPSDAVPFHSTTTTEAFNGANDIGFSTTSPLAPASPLTTLLMSITSQHPNVLNELPSTTPAVPTLGITATSSAPVTTASTSGPTLAEILASTPLSTLLANLSVPTTEAALTTLQTSSSQQPIGTDLPSSPVVAEASVTSTTITTPAITTSGTTTTVVDTTVSTSTLPAPTTIAEISTTTTTASPSTKVVSSAPPVEIIVQPALIHSAELTAVGSTSAPEEPIATDTPQGLQQDEFTTLEPVTDLPSASLEPGVELAVEPVVAETDIPSSTEDEFIELTTTVGVVEEAVTDVVPDVTEEVQEDVVTLPSIVVVPEVPITTTTTTAPAPPATELVTNPATTSAAPTTASSSSVPDTTVVSITTAGPAVEPETIGTSTTLASPTVEVVTSTVVSTSTLPVTFAPSSAVVPEEQSTAVPETSSASTETPVVEITAEPVSKEPATTTATVSTTLAELNDTVEGPTVQFQNYREVCGRPKYQYPSARIVGGTTTQYGQWPWQVSLRQWRTATFLHKCGAALLNENWAITAAHCVDNVQPDDLLLRMGEYDLATDEEDYPYIERKVQIVASHPQFDSRTFEYDLALLRFYDPVRFQPNIVPICLPPPSEVDFVGRTAYVTGWGRLYEDGPLPSKMQQVSVPVINNTDCESMYRRAGYVEHIPNIFICAGYADGKRDSCEGDSGGPMVIQEGQSWVLAGVISWGIGCAEANQPGVYTRISEFREWIDKIIVF